MSSIRPRNWTTKDGQQKSAWQVDYKDQNGKRRSKQFARKKDAEGWRIQALSEVSRGIHTPERDTITFSDAAAFYISRCKARHLEPTTIAPYDQHIRLHLAPRCGGMKLSRLTAPYSVALLDDLMKDLSGPMATRVFRTYKAVLIQAHQAGHIAQNPAQAIRPPRKSKRKYKAKIPTKAQIRELLEVAGSSDDLLGRTALETFVFSGMRVSELRALGWEAIDLERGTIEIHRRADARGIIGPTKTPNSHRVIPISTRLIELLKAWQAICPPHPDKLVFPSPTGKVISHRVLYRRHLIPLEISANQFEKDADTDTVFHRFRHAAASLWIENGLNPKRIQTLMGHSSIQITFDTYGHLFDQVASNRAEADAIEAALFEG